MELIESKLFDASLFSDLSHTGDTERKKILVSLYQYCSASTGGYQVDHELLSELEFTAACGRGGHLLMSEQTAIDKECAERIATRLFALYDDLPEINDLDGIEDHFESSDLDSTASIQDSTSQSIYTVYGGYLHPTARSPQSILVRFLSDVVLVFSHHYRIIASAIPEGREAVKVVISEPLLSPTSLSLFTKFTSMRGCDCPREAPVSLEDLGATEDTSGHGNDSDEGKEVDEKREITRKIRVQAIRNQQTYMRTIGLSHSFMLLARALLLTAALHFGTSTQSEDGTATAGWKAATELDTNIVEDHAFSEISNEEENQPPKAKKGRKTEKDKHDNSEVLQWLFQYETEEWSDEIVGLFPELDNLRRYFVIRLLESVKTSVFQQQGRGEEPLEVESYFTLLTRLCLSGDCEELCQHIVLSQQTRMAFHRDIVLLLLGDLLAVLGPSKGSNLTCLFSKLNMEAPAKAVATAIMPRDLLPLIPIPVVHAPPQVVLHFGSDYTRSSLLPSCPEEGYGPHPLALYAVDTIRRYVDGCLQLVRSISLGVAGSSRRVQYAVPTTDVNFLIQSTQRNMKQLEDSASGVQLIFSNSLKNGSLFYSRFFNIHCMSVASVGATLLLKMSVLFPDFTSSIKVFPKLASTASRCSETLRDIHSTVVEDSDGTSTGILLGDTLSEIVATFFIKSHPGHVLSFSRDQISFDNTFVNQARPFLLLSVYLFLQSVNLCWNATLQYICDYTANSAAADAQLKRNELFCNYFNPVMQSMRRHAGYQNLLGYHTDSALLRSNESTNPMMLISAIINKAKRGLGILTEATESEFEGESETYMETKAFFLADSTGKNSTEKNMSAAKGVIALCSVIPFVCLSLSFSYSSDTNGNATKPHHNTVPYISVPFRDALIASISKQVESFKVKLLLEKKDRAYEKKRKEWCDTALGAIPLDYVIQTVIESLRCLDSTVLSSTISGGAEVPQSQSTMTGNPKDQRINEAERLFKHGEEEGSYEPFFEFLHKEGLLRMRKEAALIAQKEELRNLRGASDANRIGKRVPLGDIAKKVRGGVSTTKNSELQLGLLGPRGQLQRAGFISLFRGALKISHGLSEDDPFSSEPRVRAAHTMVARCLNQLPLDVRDHCTDLVCECLREEIRLHQEAKKVPSTSDFRSIFSLCMQCLFISTSQSAMIKHKSMLGETPNRTEIPMPLTHLNTSSNISEQLNIRKPLEWIQRADIGPSDSGELSLDIPALFIESDTLAKGNRYSHLAVRFFITLLSSGGRTLPEATILEFIHGCPVLTNFIWSTIHRRLCLGDASKQTVRSLLFSLAIPAFFESCDDAELGLTLHLNTAGHRSASGMNVILSIIKHRPSYTNQALSSLLYFCSDASAAGLRRDGTRRAALKAIQKVLLPVRVTGDTEYCSLLAPYSPEETIKYEERIFEFAIAQADKFISYEVFKNSGISVPKPIMDMAEVFDFCIQGNEQVQGLKELLRALPEDDTLATQAIEGLVKAIDIEHRLVYEWHTQYNYPVAEQSSCPLASATAIIECHVGLLLTIGTLSPGRFAPRCLTKIMEVYSSIASSVASSQTPGSLRTAISTEVSSASLMRSLLASADLDLLIRQAFGGLSTKKETISFNNVQYTEVVPDFTQAHRFLLFVMPTLRNYPNGASDIVFKVFGVLALCVRSLVSDTCRFLAGLEDSDYKNTIKMKTTKELEGLLGVLSSHCDHMFNHKSALYLLHHKHNSVDLIATPIKGDIRMMIPVLGFIPRDILISRYIPALARFAVITKCNRDILMTTASYDTIQVPTFVSNHLSVESILRQFLFPGGTMLTPITISSEQYIQSTINDHTTNVLPRSLCDAVADKVLEELLWHFLVPCKGGFLAYPGLSSDKYNTANSGNKVGISPPSLVKSLATFFSQIRVQVNRGIKDDLDVLIFLQPIGEKAFRQFLGHLASTHLCPSVIPISPFSSTHIGSTSGAILSHILRDISRYFPDGNYWEDLVKLMSNSPTLMNSYEAFQIVQQVANPYGAAELLHLLRATKDDLLGDSSVLANIIQQHVVCKGIMAFSTSTSFAASKQMTPEEEADMTSKWPTPPSAVSLLSLPPFLAQLQVTVLSNMMVYQEVVKYSSEPIDISDGLIEMPSLSLELLHLSFTSLDQVTKALESIQKKLLPLQNTAVTSTTNFPSPEPLLKLEDICIVFDGLFKDTGLSNMPHGYSNLNDEHTSNEIARSLAHVIREAGERLYKNAKPLLDRRPPPTVQQPPLLPEVNLAFPLTPQCTI